MNPIEKDLRSYFGITSESNILEHYGTKRHSGRYPWGSGDNPYQHSGDFLSRVEELKKKGLSEKEILETINDSLPDEYKMGLTEFRTARQKAGHDRKALEYDQIRALKDDGLGWKEIGDKLGMSESSVRSKYNNAIGEKASQAEKIAATLKEEVDKKGMIDISEGANQVLGVSESKLDEAAYILEAEYGYAVPEGNPNNVRLMKKEEKQREMGVISNLITDMTLRGADEDELARAVKHSMVVIDAEKHKLDYKRSERENGIPELKQKWQIRVDEEGATHYGGASTLLSRRKQTVRVPERRGSVRVDKETGEYIYKESGRTFTDPKTGKERKAEDTVSLISETKDARTLSSGTIQENLYADFSNKLKAMANQARKEAVNMKGIQRNPEAAKTYAPEVASLKEKYNNMVANKPKERKAMLIANANIKAKIQEQGLDPTIDKKEIKKISSVEMQRARDSVGASGRKSKITFTDREWEAVQAGAISDNMLTKFLNSSDSDEIVKRAMPKNVAVMTSAKMSKANAMLRSGYSYAEIAKACGVPESTVYSALNK